MKTVLVAILLLVFVLGAVWLREDRLHHVQRASGSQPAPKPPNTPVAPVAPTVDQPSSSQSAVARAAKASGTGVLSAPTPSTSSSGEAEHSSSTAKSTPAEVVTRPTPAPPRVAPPKPVDYAKQRARFLSAAADNPARARRLFAAIEPTVLSKRDAEVAKHIGWLMYHDEKYRTAVAWFALADVWTPDAQAAYGLALSRLRLGDTAGAIAIAQRDAAHSSDARAVVVEATLEEALAAHQQGDYTVSLERLAALDAYGALPRAAVMLQAWNLAGLERDQEAAELFTALYRQQPDMDSALGIFLSYSRLGEWQQLDTLSLEFGGPLDTHPTEELAKAAQQRGDALKAQRFLQSQVGVASKR